MIFSQTCQYAIKACIYLAIKKEKIDVEEISDFIKSPVSFTSKILQKLAKNQLISSSKGRNGGFFLSEEQHQNLMVKDICSLFDFDTVITKCALGLDQCGDENPCPIHHIVFGIKEKINIILNYKINYLKNTGNIEFIQSVQKSIN